jgi:hypothetical protein
MAAVWLLAAAASARAAAYEGFDYPVGPHTAAWRGGSGFVDGTTTSTPNGWFGGATSLGGSLTDPSGTLSVTGNRVQTEQGSIERRLAQTMGTPNTDVWISWLQRRSENGLGFQGLALFQPNGSGASGVYFIGEPGAGPADGTYVIGQAGDDFTVVSSGVPVVANETAFLVAHLQFREGNDLATLYVNPTPGAAAPSGGVTYSGLDMPITNPLLSFEGAATSQQVAHQFDELRIGDSYAAVAPAVPEPAAAAWVVAAAALIALRRRRA